jgi:hypothetical protein
MKQWLIFISIFLSLSFNAFADPVLERGLAAAKMGKWDIALRAFKEAGKKEPFSPAILYNLGLSHAKSGNHLLGVVWLEAYLAANPEAGNISQVRSTIAQLEVLAESQSDDLFERALGILDAAPFEQSFAYSQGKWQEARGIARDFANIGNISKAREMEALAIRYAQKAGAADGQVKMRDDEELRSFYARNLANIGMFEEAWHHHTAINDQYKRGDIAYAISISPLINNKELRFLFETADKKRLMGNSGFTTPAKNLWLAGDVQGLLFLAEQLRGKGAEKNPARLELAHGLLGLGHKKEALKLAKGMPADPDAPMLDAVVKYLLNAGGSFGCYEGNPRSTLWQMFLTRQYALSGELESAAKAKDSVPAAFKNTGDWEDKEIKLNKARRLAFGYYASREVDKAIAALAAAGEDVTSFLKIILRHAAATDPRYAVSIAKLMDPPHLGPYLLQEEAERAEARNNKARAKILQLEAKKLAKQLGNEMFSSSPSLRQWLDLAVMFSSNSTLSSLPSVLKQVASGGKVPFEPLSLEPDFVFNRHEYRCPPPPYKGPYVPAPVRDRAQGYEYSRAPEISNAAEYIGDALLYIRGTRARVNKR